MGIQVIKRDFINKTQDIETFCGRAQISYNSDGRLVARLIFNNTDTLFVMDECVSKKVILFSQEVLANMPTAIDDIPF